MSVTTTRPVSLQQLSAEAGVGLSMDDRGDDRTVTVVDGAVDDDALLSLIEAHRPRPRPLDAAGVAATLNAVLGVWPLSDAANAVRLPEQALVDEANAWAETAAGGA